jgi:type II secretory pathway component GspD/PulD (secretin)
MNTRTPQIIVLALLAALPVTRVLAQQPAAPVAATATSTASADTPVAAEAAATPAPGTAAVVAVVRADGGGEAAAVKSKDATGRDTLSVDFPDEDIRNILRNVADLFELNIIMPDALQGKTTIKLRDVTLRQIFQSVLHTVNFTYIEDGNIIKIVSNESLMQ